MLSSIPSKDLSSLIDTEVSELEKFQEKVIAFQFAINDYIFHLQGNYNQ